MRIRRSFVVSGPAERVFAYVADPSNAADWWPNLHASWRPSNQPPLGVGTITRCVACLLGRRFEVRQRITEFETGRRLGLQHFTGYDGEVHWTFEPLNDGVQTRVTVDACYVAPQILLEVFGGDRRFVERIVAGDVRHGLRNLEAMLNWLADAVPVRGEG
jgi:uncharacterized protein YndB with AHSA1/START domain